MLFEVECYYAGKTFCVEYYARDYAEAKRLAQRQYPNVTIVGVNAIFG